MESRRVSRARQKSRLTQLAADIEPLEDRRLLTATIAHNYAGIDFLNSQGYIPPDTCGAAGPVAYMETTNQEVALFMSKGTGTPREQDSLQHFLFVTGRLPVADSSSGLSDPIVVYDEQIGRFIIGDQDVDFNTHVSTFDIAVSKTSNPTDLSTANWNFYQIRTVETGFDADYPGNFGYNHDAFVFTLNMFGVSGGGHVLVTSVSAADLKNGVSQSALHVFKNDVNTFSLRPTTMHDSVAGDPMWFVAEHGDGASIDVYKMTNVLSNTATFRTTNLAVASYFTSVPPLNPDGSVITFNTDSRILKAAEWNHLLVATHAVSDAAGDQDMAQWYEINVTSGTPVLVQQGRISGGQGVYITYPGIDINSSGQIGMSYIRQGTDTPFDFMSMYVTGRVSTDPLGTMETPVLVPAGTGVANYSDFGSPFGEQREGDLSGINVDPVNGSFWAANEFANNEGFAGANWGTAIANFTPTVSLSPPTITSAIAISPTSAFVRWTAANNTQGYKVFVNGSPVPVAVFGPTTLSGVVNGLPSGSTSSIVIEAFNSNLNPSTADSAPAFVTTPVGLTPPIVNFEIESPTTALLMWSSVSGADGYRVFELLSDGSELLLATLDPSTTSLQLVGLAPNTTTQFIVEAFRGSVVADSPVVDITTPPAFQGSSLVDASKRLQGMP